MLFIYPAVFHNEDNSYWVEFPDLEGCQTFADDLPEAMKAAKEALAGYLLTLLEENIDIAKPSDIKGIVCDPDSFTTLISCDLAGDGKVRSVKKTLTIPKWLNERAMAKGINFSRVLQDALISQISA